MAMTPKAYERLRESLKGEDFRTLKDRIQNGDFLSQWEYDAVLDNTRNDRMGWWREARFGMIVHYGLYALTGRSEWAMYYDSMPFSEYEALADQFMPKENIMEEWVLTAKDAGAKYLVMVTRHHDGFSLWDSKVNPYNSCNYGCKRDLVREFVDACRKHDMRIGLYSSIMDWHYPDSYRAGFSPIARKGFLEYLEALNTELLTNYGKIDILWYDTVNPMHSAEAWESLQRNQKLRVLQPDIIINDRSVLPEDFTTPEEHLEAMTVDWESTNTFNGLSWGYMDEEQSVNYTLRPQEVVKKLAFCCRNKGNFMLNLGPRPDGTIAAHEKEILHKVGQWIRENEEVVYGTMRACKAIGGSVIFGEYGGGSLMDVSAKGNTVYLWNFIWSTNGRLYASGYKNAPKKVYLVRDHKELDFEYDAKNYRIIIKNLPKQSPDQTLGITLIAMEFDEDPIYRTGMAFPQTAYGHIER